MLIPTTPLEKVVSCLSKGEKLFGSESMSMPSGLLYISGYLKNSDIAGKTYLLDYSLEISRQSNPTNIEDFISEAARKSPIRPDILAFTANFTTSHEFLVTCAEVLKNIWPDSISIVGGHHATSQTAVLLKLASVDFVARGEGEIGFTEFVRAIGIGKKPGIQGIFSKEDISSKLPLTTCEIADDLDELPFPDWDLIEMESYVNGSSNLDRKLGEDALGESNKRMANFSASRGCPFSCTFCASHLVHGRRMRWHSIERVMKEMRILNSRYGVNTFMPDDDLFTANKDKTKMLLTAFRDNFPDCILETPNGLSVNTLNFEILDLFIQTGTKIITLAVESGNEFVQRNVIKKRCDLSKAQEQVKYLRERGVIVRTFFIIGFPTETKGQMVETIEFARKLKCDWVGICVAFPLPGTELFDEFVDLGYVVNDQNFISDNINNIRTFDTPEASAEEIRDLLYYGNLQLNFFENTNKLEGNFQQAIDLFYDVVHKFPHHIVAWYCIMECLDGLGQTYKAEEIYNKIGTLLKTNSVSLDMYVKTKHLMPKLCEELLEV